MTAEELAELFHETYEKLAPIFKYETRLKTRVPWKNVSEPNRALMITTAQVILLALNKPIIGRSD